MREVNVSMLLITILCAASGLSAQKESAHNIWLRLKDLPDDSIKLQSLIEQSEAPDNRSHPDTVALFLHEAAKVHWSLGNAQQGLEADRKALGLRKAYRQSDPENYCRSAFNLGMDFIEFGLRDSAIHYLNEVIQLSPVSRQKSRAAYEIGDLNKANGEFSLAIPYARQALHYAREDSLHSDIQNAYILMLDTYNIMLHQGDAQAGDSILLITKSALSYLTSLQPESGILRNTALVYWYEGNAYKMQEAYDTAESRMLTAQRLLSQSEIDDPRFSSELFNSRGILLRRLRRYDEAYRVLNEALNMRIAAGDSLDIAVTENNLGDLCLDQRLFPEAIEHYHNSIWLLVGEERSSDKTSLPRYHELRNHPRLLDCFRYVVFVADAWRYYCTDSGNQGHCITALHAYALGDSLVDAFRSRHVQEGSKLFWREDAKRFYSGAIAASLQTGNSELAVYYTDRSKAILVLDAVREHMVRNSPSRPLIEKKDSLLQVIHALETSAKRGEQWIAANAALDQINVRLKETLPSSVESAVFSPSRIEAYAQSLDENEAIVQYFDAAVQRDEYGLRDTLYAFVITRKGVRSVGLKKPQVMQALNVYQVERQAFLTKGMAPQTAGTDPLFDLLVKPLGELPENITIIPDGAIAQISFDGLKDEQGKYLVESKTIRYDLSLAMADVMSRIVSENAGQVLAFAPMTQALCDQDDLPFTKLEISRIGDIVKSRLFFGSNATRNTLLEFQDNYSVLHLATHASANTLDPGNSWIALAGDTSACALLYVHDLYTMYMPSSMVVVSACEGAYGTYAAGEGAMSVARGFAFAGTASVVTSLWQVNDQATAYIMESFYRFLKQGMSKSQALRQAKLEYLRDERRKKVELHPAWWSAFVVIGNDAPLKLEGPPTTSVTYFIVLGVVALLVIGIFGWKGWKKRNQVEVHSK